ncbi:hypothetical protein RHS03_06389, partial [Rhizoctonia solani]
MTTSINSLIAAMPKLDGNNYHDWAFDIKMIAMRAGTWDVLTGVQKPPKDGGGDWEKLDRDAYTMIGLSVGRSEMVHVRDCKTAHQAWTALEEIYARSSRANRIALRQKMNMVSLVDDDVQDYVAQISDLAARLRASGVNISDEEEADILIMNLPSTWNHVASSLMIRPGVLTVKDVATVLREELVRREHEKNGGRIAAFAARSTTGQKNRNQAPSVDRRECYRCRKRGHIAANCDAPAPVSRSESPSKEPKKTENANVAQDHTGSSRSKELPAMIYAL